MCNYLLCDIAAEVRWRCVNLEKSRWSTRWTNREHPTSSEVDKVDTRWTSRWTRESSKVDARWTQIAHLAEHREMKVDRWTVP
jgi:hypothetical protein